MNMKHWTKGMFTFKSKGFINGCVAQHGHFGNDVTRQESSTYTNKKTLNHTVTVVMITKSSKDKTGGKISNVMQM